MTEVAVITGVSRGIGRACALAIAERHMGLALVGRPSESHSETRRACAERSDAQVESYDCDLSKHDDIERTCAAIIDRHGAPSLVINNAGHLERGPLVHEIDIATWDHILDTNLRGPFLVSRALLPSMLAAKRGRFIHIASISGTIACPHMAHYGASKWGLIGFHKALSEELRGTGVSSIAVLPGSVDTAMLEKTPFEPDMSADEVAKVVVYYGLDAPPVVHGAEVQVYG